MQIPILSGIYANEAADFRTSYPRNVIPVANDQGISKGYLRPADGIVSFATGPGRDRGGISWDGLCYRAMGPSLVSIDPDGNVTTIGTIDGSISPVSFAYSFDRLAVASEGDLYYWDNTTLSQVTDPDLGEVLDVIWVDGYFMTTDGTSIIVTELDDPFAVNPLKYGSAEAEPDSILALKKIRNEVYALNRYTIEVFSNTGGELFPFQRIEGAYVPRGTLGTHCCTSFIDSIAFLGSAYNESPGIHVAVNGASTKLSTREIDKILADYSEGTLANSVLEARIDQDHRNLMLHLPDQSLVYDAGASSAVGTPVWYTLDSGTLTDKSIYRARYLTWCYDQWLAGDTMGSSIGRLDNTVHTHYGDSVGWEFSTPIIYNESRGGIVHVLELVGLPGRVTLGDDPMVYTAYSLDGETWSQDMGIQAGMTGERNKRLIWVQQGAFRNWRIQRFRGTSDASIAIARLEAQVEPLSA